MPRKLPGQQHIEQKGGTTGPGRVAGILEGVESRRDNAIEGDEQ